MPVIDWFFKRCIRSDRFGGLQLSSDLCWTKDLNAGIQEIMGPGGYVCFGKGQGEDAGVIARRILLGKSPSEIPIIGKSGQFAWRRSQIVKWNIRIPADWLVYSEFKD